MQPDSEEGAERSAGAEETAPRPRRRGRTALLLGAAAALGLVAGTCAGYLVQADREPTRLPSLSQPLLAPAGDETPKRLPAAQDRKVRTDGDLRELLLKKPRGAVDVEWPEGSGGWLDLPTFAGLADQASGDFAYLVENEFRRAATVAWKEDDGRTVEIRVTQFRHEEVLAAADYVQEGAYWRPGEVDSGSPIPGTGDGRAYSHEQPRGEPGASSRYMAEAHARRGDLVLTIWVTGPERIAKKTILDLAERQLERL
ncbi:hypothetical protein [Streptomyces sp. NPDC046988]|uniref:hypothetical protein n=1 Tax=Streptomyces sp. NPDC046988 TaxID=3154922 RepID=UPI0033DD44F8